MGKCSEILCTCSTNKVWAYATHLSQKCCVYYCCILLKYVAIRAASARSHISRISRIRLITDELRNSIASNIHKWIRCLRLLTELIRKCSRNPNANFRSFAGTQMQGYPVAKLSQGLAYLRKFKHFYSIRGVIAVNQYVQYLCIRTFLV